MLNISQYKTKWKRSHVSSNLSINYIPTLTSKNWHNPTKSMKKVTNQNQNKNHQIDRKKNPWTTSFVFNKIIMLFPLTNEKNVLSCFTLCMCAFNLHVHMKTAGISIMVLIDRNMPVRVKIYHLWENSKKKKKAHFFIFFALCINYV